MTKNDQNRVLAWRLKLLREASVTPRNVAQACRHFGLSRKTFYKWKARHKAHGEAGLLDRPRVPLRSPRATPREVVSKILYLRQRYHFGPGRIAAYLRRFHGLSVARSSVHRILIRHGLNRLPANQRRKPAGRAWQLAQVLNILAGVEYFSPVGTRFVAIIAPAYCARLLPLTDYLGRGHDRKPLGESREVSRAPNRRGYRPHTVHSAHSPARDPLHAGGPGKASPVRSSGLGRTGHGRPCLYRDI